jgi:hypothetical protein
VPNRPGKADEDRRYLLAKLAKLEQQAEQARALKESLARPHEADLREQAAELERRLRIQVDAVEHTIRMDREHGRYR